MTLDLIRPLRAALFVLGLLSLLASCATKPPAASSAEEPTEDFGLLPPGGAVYCYVDVPGARPILDKLSLEGMTGEDLAEILNRTSWASAAFYPPRDVRRFQVVARGRYPASRIGFSLSLDPEWKKRKSETGPSYWYSASLQLGISLDSRRALVSNTDPLVKPPGAEPPPGFGDFLRDSGELPRRAILAGWIESAAEPLNRFLSSLGLPLEIPAERAFFAVYPREGEAGARLYEALLRLETPSATQARALTALFAMTRTLAGGTLDGGPFEAVAPFFANRPVQDGAAIGIRSSPLEETRIALLFNLFSVYSK